MNMPILKIQFPEDFNERYDAYKAKLLKSTVGLPQASSAVITPEKIDEDEKKKIMATKPPSFTMKVLRPIANLIAKYTSPSQINSIAKQFGFEENAKTPDEVAGALLQMFETLREENNDEDIKKIIETLLTLYAQLVDEKLHDKGLIGPVRGILHRGHFNLGFNPLTKGYFLLPFEGPEHGVLMRAEGTTEHDFQDGEKRKMRIITNSEKIGNGTVQKSIPTLKINGDFFMSGNQKVPMERGQRSMTELFLKHAEINRNNKCVKKGRNLSTEELQKAGSYGTEKAFRNALKKIREKLLNGKLPASIKNNGTRKYQMVIEYNKT